MDPLYIDYTHSIPRQQTKVHGGANYTKMLLISILNYTESLKDRKKIIVLWPEGYSPSSEVENKIYDNEHIEILHVKKNICDIDFEPGATLFIPLLGIKEFHILKEIKEKKVNIIMTIHGLRLLDYKIDLYNLKYEIGFIGKIKALLLELALPTKQLIYKYSLRKYSKYVDTIITVSNYTLSRLTKFCHIKDILLQFQGTYLMANLKKNDKKDENYILFVSGNRCEKNLARSIVAYKQCVDNFDYKTPLYVVGTSKKTRDALSKSLKLKDLINQQYIVFFDYVDDDKLAAFYQNASFLLYTSKSEGFGLPALEAAKFGCPVVAAYGTSIPEVLGTSCIYVNPYSMESIKNGIIKMSREKKHYKSITEETYYKLIPRIQDSNKAVIKKLFETI